jgi:CRP/FNR family transcriptional regulator
MHEVRTQGDMAARPVHPFAADLRSTADSAAVDALAFSRLRTGTCKVHCSSCRLREMCLPVGLTPNEIKEVDNGLVASLRKVARGATLFRAGDCFDTVFAVWTGSFKTVVTSNHGIAQVTGFQMCGDLIGLGGIDTGLHEVAAVALEDSQVCVIPYAGLETLTRKVPALQKHLHRLMSREISTNHQLMLQLGSMHAEERVATFVLDLLDRLQARGFSSSSMLLNVSREEIGSLLGLKLETVSRAFSKLHSDGVLSVHRRHIDITDMTALHHVVEGVSVANGI